MEDLLSRLLGIEQVQLEDGEVSLDWLTTVPPWLMALVALVIFAGAIYLYRKERQAVGRGPKIFLAVLRTLAILVILTMLLGPMLTVDIAKEKKAVVLILVDDSLSMGKRDPRPKLSTNLDELAKVCGVTPEQASKMVRLELVKSALENKELGILEDLEDRMRVALFAFSKRARQISREDLAKLEPTGTETAIGDAMQIVDNQFRGEKIAAVVLITDGRNNTGRDPSELAGQFAERRIPVITLAPGFPQEPMDVALGDIQAQDMLPVNDKMTIQYSLASRGFDGEEQAVDFFIFEILDERMSLPTDPDDIEALLSDPRARLIRTERIQMTGGTQPAPPIDWTPRQKGLFAVILRARPREDEITRKNNYVLSKLRVTDDLVKVLYIDHLPRWEFRYLKNAMVRHDNLLVHVLLTSADQEFGQPHSLPDGRPREQVDEYKNFFRAITTFPSDMKTLLSYEVIVVGDVAPGRLGDERTLKNVRDFVTEFGGGLVFISGTRYTPEAYLQTPLRDLVPVELEPRRPFSESFDRELHYVLSEFGKRHPAMKFHPNASENVRIWEDRAVGLEPLYWYKRVKKIKSGAAEVLAYLQSAQEGGRRHPLFVTQPAGRGRVMISLTDETWRWRRNVGDGPYFFPFWLQWLRYLREPRLRSARRYRVWVDQERYSIGDEVTIHARAFDRNYQPLTDPELELEIIPPTGEPNRFMMSGDGKGNYSLKFHPRDVGRYEIRVGDPREPSEMGVQSFEVIIPNREEENPIIDEDRLRTIASHGEGAYLRLHDAKSILDHIKSKILTFTEKKQDDIWDSPFFYLLFALLITTEWIVRKVYRML